LQYDLKRIKILKESGYNWGDVEIYYQHFNNVESLSSLKAQIIQPDGTKVSVSKKDIFKEAYSKYVTKASFAFPQLKVGSVIEWKYSINSERIFQIKDKYFQYSIPCRRSEYFAELPTMLNFVLLSQGSIALESEKKETNKSYEWGAQGATQYNYKANNVPALKSENYITTMDDYRSRLRFQLSEIRIPGQYKEILSSWNQVGNELLDEEKLGRQCFRKGNHKTVLDALGDLKGSTDKEKLREVFNFVVSKIEWDGTYGIYANDNLNKVFTKQTGNGAAINLMMIALLNEHGIASQPALISTRRHGSPIPVYPILSQFNHLIARLEIDGKAQFIDISNEYRSLECLRINSLNKHALTLEKDNSRWENIVPKIGVDSYYIDAKIDEDGNISGLFKGRYIGYNAIPEREAYAESENSNHWQKRMEEKYPEIEVSDVKHDPIKATSNNFKDEFNFNIEEAWTDGGEKVFLDPILYTAMLVENPFKLKERSYPVDIPYPFKEQYIFNLTLPAGYTLIEPPAPLKLGLPNKAARFTYAVSLTENKIQLVANFSINQLIFEPQDYEALKAFYDQSIAKYKEQLVLVKK
jgi:hypothetical protein